MDSEQPVLIIGAGLVGLALGQALKRASIPFRIYERDASLTTRRQGWAVTLHWALSFLPELLPDDVLARLVSSAQVDPANGAGGHDGGNFLFLDLRDCSVKFKIPPNRRWRLHREKARAALLCGLEDRVVWGARVVDVVVQPSGSAERPTIVFEDGTTATGRLVVGVDGSRSRIRQVLAPATFRNEQLPLRFTGVAVDMTAEAIAPLRALDPLLFQGLHPPTRTFMWYSVLETPPAANGTTEKESSGSQEQGKTYRAQLNMSWPVEGPEDEVADTDSARLEFMKQRARHFDPRLRRVWEGIPEGTVVTEVKLADWPCLEWDNRNGRVTLASDAAHAMTMYRGEAANHGLLDALLLVGALKKVYSGEVEQQEAINEYEKEMRKRAGPAVLMSRQACYDAHTWESLTEDCAVLKRRAIESLP
ncbi:Monooxygenase [Lasiodiplodia theobromae]|uniref:Monooxygenase n=1 Tax=Lasiodiplodia theobromae TaxID=45133 RepID=UPI0015C37164|nr:Monooxygenase [Lasiodiplodia theobromae]KAF4535349.1 Monooxygenase [Lasiodiplodia theobromae]